MNMEELIDTMDTAAQREAFDLLFGGDSLGARPCAATGRSARSTLGGGRDRRAILQSSLSYS